jgi:FAD/FMN-containing dehydrogenase
MTAVSTAPSPTSSTNSGAGSPVTLRRDVYSRILYITDASLYQVMVMPHAVLIPKTAADVYAAVKLAAQYRVRVLARAAGTSLAGQAVNAATADTWRNHAR